MTDIEPDLIPLVTDINNSGLGPIVFANTIDDGGFIFGIDESSPRKARTALQWWFFLTVYDMIADKRHESDDNLRLGLRGYFPSGVLAIVVIPFNDPEQIEVINNLVEEQRPFKLLTRLVEIEIRKAVASG